MTTVYNWVMEFVKILLYADLSAVDKSFELFFLLSNFVFLSICSEILSSFLLQVRDKEKRWRKCPAGKFPQFY